MGPTGVVCHVDMRAYCTNSVFLSISWGALRPAEVYPRIARVEQFYRGLWVFVFRQRFLCSRFSASAIHNEGPIGVILRLLGLY